MNIFILNEDPTEAASMLCDRHVVKMTLETAQILCTVHGQGPYKPTHRNHPCVKWAGESERNYIWVLSHGLALDLEFKHRFGKQHKSGPVITGSYMHYCGEAPALSQTPFVQCMPDEHKAADAVTAYRAYYRAKADEWEAKGRPMKWRRNTQRPEWMGD